MVNGGFEVAGEGWSPAPEIVSEGAHQGAQYGAIDNISDEGADKVIIQSFVPLKPHTYYEFRMAARRETGEGYFYVHLNWFAEPGRRLMSTPQWHAGRVEPVTLPAGWGVSGYLGMIFTPKICSRLNYRQINYFSSAVGVAASVALFFIPKNVAAIFSVMLIVGFPNGIVSNINYSMIADSVDYVEWKTGKRTEGITVSFQTLMNKTMTALQSSLVSLVLIFVNFVEPVEVAGELVPQPQTSSTLNGFILMFTLIPAAGWLISAFVMKYYTFIGEERRRAHEEIVLRRTGLTADETREDL